MSGDVRIGEGSPIPQRQGSRLEITFAVKEKGVWKTPQLNAAESHAVRGAIETIQQMGVNAAAWNAFNEEGAVLEMTASGVFVRKEEGWKDLLSDPSVGQKVKAGVKRSLDAVTGILGDKATAGVASQEIAGNAEALRQGNVVIQVRVVPAADVIAKRYEAEQAFYNGLLDLQQHVKSDRTVQSLKRAHMTDEQIGRMQIQMDRLVGAEKKVHDLMLEVRDLMQQGKVQEAVALYVQEMPQHYEVFSNAMRLWQIEQRHLKNQLGEANLIIVDINHVLFQVETARELFALAAFDTSQALQQIVGTKTRFYSALQLARDVEGQVSSSRKTEAAFNGRIRKALITFDHPLAQQHLTALGWTQEEMAAYKGKLTTLKAQSDEALRILDTTLSWLGVGAVQEGMDLFCAEMKQHYPTYVRACQELAAAQKVAQGQNLTRPLEPFLLDLSHPQGLTDLLDRVSTETFRAGGDAPQHFPIMETEWIGARLGMVSQAEALQKSLTFSPVADHLNGNHKFNQEFTSRIGAFVQAYQANRDQFDAIMRSHGINDIESARLFNHYVALHAALKNWDNRFQEVVDLANNKQYAEALAAYTDLVEKALPQLLAQVQQVQELGGAQVQKAFQKFAQVTGLSNPKQLLADLGNKMMGSKQLAIFIECIEKTVAAGIPIPNKTMQVLNQARELVETNVSAASSRLFVQNQRVMQFFNHNDLLQPKHPLQRQWQSILIGYGWHQTKVQDFANLTNQYAALIRPLKQAEHAIAMESDPGKKRALQAQLKVLAKTLMPQIDRIHGELNKRGGMDQFRKMVSAANDLAARAPTPEAMAGLQAEAQDLVQLMQERIDYIVGLYEDLGLVTPAGGVIAHGLLQGPHAKDPDFIDILQKQGWTPAAIQRLSTWYDAYMKEAYLLNQAKRNLDADPENVTLQKAFKKVAEEQIPKLDALRKEFNDKIGNKEALRNLEQALTSYRDLVAADLAKTQADLVGGNLKPQRKGQLEKQVREAQTTLAMLAPLHILDSFERAEAFVAEMSHLFYLPMSWDEDFLSELVPDPASPLMQYQERGILWEKLLREQELNEGDIKSILKLLHNYQKQAEKIMVLERELEAHPGNSAYRRDLLHELSIHGKALQSLDQEFVRLSEKIVGLESAIQAFQTHMDKVIGQMRGIRETAINADPTMLESARKSEQEAVGLFQLASRLHVWDAFNQKRGFIADVKRRFTRMVS